MHACVPSQLSRVRLFATLWTVAHQAPLSMGFSRQEYCSGLLCPPPEDLPNPGVKPASLMSPALAGGFFSTHATWEAQIMSSKKLKGQSLTATAEVLGAEAGYYKRPYTEHHRGRRQTT